MRSGRSRRKTSRRRWTALAIVAATAGLGIAVCVWRAIPPAGTGEPRGSDARLAALPSLAGAERPAGDVKSAYLFAGAHPEVIRYVPCFCGCERLGHRSNHDCFVRARDAEGRVATWDAHAVG